MDKALRNTLRNTVTQCRRLLEGAVAEVLEGHYGIHSTGAVEDAARLSHLDPEEEGRRARLVDHLHHIQETLFGGGQPTGAAAEQLIREIGFTHLNRLCAFKILESRRVLEGRRELREIVGRGLDSTGFKFYLAGHLQDEERWSGGQQDVAYRHYLQWLCETLSSEVGALFSPHDPAHRLSLPHRVVEEILALINSPALAQVWGDDEAIGWIYQYYTPKELRDQARKASSAPRNSYELAFRNQFFTPRFVVEFLVDNTLGRLWYEMRQGETALSERCRYLVRRKHPVFLKPGEEEPEPFPASETWGDPDEPGEMWTRPNPGLHDLHDVWRYALTVGGYHYARRRLGVECGDLANECLERYRETGKWEGTFEELRCRLFFEQRRWHHFGQSPGGDNLAAITALHRAICQRWDVETEFIRHRARKDPREIAILDPACGSGHFLLYCFDLLETIYQEAYDDPDLGPALRRDYPDREAFRRDIPALILRRNLHGVDIDLRSVQIAGLALWLRAQRAHQELGLAATERPRITRANLVCAEPMPGERELLEEFIATLQPPLLGQLVRVVFDKMKLAGDAGSLLKIEQEIHQALAEARRQWKAAPKLDQLLLWPAMRRPKPEQLTLFDVAGITDEAFWEEAEGRLLEALEAYAEKAENGRGYLRRLFAEDASQGVGFVDLCRRRFDVVLMNPPFGDASRPAKAYIERAYPRTKNDLYATFVERGLGWLEPGGLLGAITSRTGFFLSSFRRWREEILLQEARPTVFADLGYGVLDTAMVETAAYCLERAG